jgi:putative nucleotidyltransferase with HDIG domain
MRTYLPLALVVTLLVIVVPALVVSAIVPRGSPLTIAVSVVLAVALSMALATGGAAVWKRLPHSCDIVFADLLIWGWLRHCWSERRLSQARALYDSAKMAGPAVSIELLTGLSRLLEARDPYTHGHGQRVARFAGQIAKTMSLSDVEVARIRTAAAVHDVGKLYTPKEILNNPNRLSDAEFEVAKRHAAWGARMLATVGDPEIAAIVRHHHERIDGGGYPDGLSGEKIPVGARIIAVADTFDAITSSRVYRSGATQRRALEVLSEEAGAQLDADAVAAFLSTYSARRSVGWLALATALPQRILASLQPALQGFGAGAGASGVASLLPGIGAAGLLALSPGLHRATPAVQRTQGLAAIMQPSRNIPPTGALQQIGKTISGRRALAGTGRTG